MSTNKRTREAVELLWKYWQKHCILTSSQHEWLEKNSRAHSLKRGEFLLSRHSPSVYIVCTGLLGREIFPNDRSYPHLLMVALPYYALFSTAHPYSKTPAVGHMVALRPSVVLIIPYEAFYRKRYTDECVEHLIDLLINKKKHLLDQLRALSFIESALDRYLQFTALLPDIKNYLTQQEQANLLHISRTTVQRGTRLLLKK